VKADIIEMTFIPEPAVPGWMAKQKSQASTEDASVRLGQNGQMAAALPTFNGSSGDGRGSLFLGDPIFALLSGNFPLSIASVLGKGPILA
jgi:hypothetical protein